MKKMFSLALAAIMLLTMLSTTAFAAVPSITADTNVFDLLDGATSGVTIQSTNGSIVYTITDPEIISQLSDEDDLPDSLTAQNVADYMKIGYDDGGTNSEAKEALAHYLGSSYSPTVKSSVLTQSAIKTLIDGTDPAYMQCRRPNGFLSYKYHATALIGYNFTSSSTQIEIMDPAYECYKDCTYSDGDWTFAFGAYTYTWIKTVTIK